MVPIGGTAGGLSGRSAPVRPWDGCQRRRGVPHHGAAVQIGLDVGACAHVRAAGDGADVGVAAPGAHAVPVGARPPARLRVVLEQARERLLEQVEPLRAQLGRPGLGDAQLLGDVRELAVLQVVAGHHEPGAVRELGDGVAQVPEAFGGHQGLLRPGRPVLQPCPEAVVADGERVEAEQGRPVGALEHRPDVLLAHAGRRGELGVRGLAVQRLGELLGGGGQGAGPGADRPGGPVPLAHVVDHGPADARAREAGERHPQGRIEGAGGLHERERAGPDEVVGVEVAGQARRRLTGQVADEPEVVADERLDVRCRNGHRNCFGPRPGRLSSEAGVRGPLGGRVHPVGAPAHPDVCGSPRGRRPASPCGNRTGSRHLVRRA